MKWAKGVKKGARRSLKPLNQNLHHFWQFKGCMREGLPTLDLDETDDPIHGHGVNGPRIIGPVQLLKPTRALVGTPLSISLMEKARAPEEKLATEEGGFHSQTR